MVITDRDIVIRCITDGNDPGTTTAGSLCDGPPVTIGADDPGQDVLATMAGIRCGGCRCSTGTAWSGSFQRPTSPTTPRTGTSRTRCRR